MYLEHLLEFGSGDGGVGGCWLVLVWFFLCVSQLKDFVNLLGKFIPCVSQASKSCSGEIFSTCILIRVYMTPEAPMKELDV